MKNTVLTVLGILLAAGIVFAVSCGGDNDETECAVGTLNCPCVNGNCNGSLVCEADKCIEKIMDTGTGEDPDTDTGTEEPEPEDTNPTKSNISVTNEGGGKLCAEGTVVGPVNNDADSWNAHWGAGFGINLCQTASGSDKISLGDCPTDMSRLQGFRLTVTGDDPPDGFELRIQYEDNDDTNDNGYIIAENKAVGTPADYLFKDAAVLYKAEEERPTLHPELFTSIQFQIASHVGLIEPYSFCIEDIEVILADESGDAGISDGDAGADTAETSTDPACADPDSLKIIPNKDSGWVAGCSNAAGIQGDMYPYEDPGE